MFTTKRGVKEPQSLTKSRSNGVVIYWEIRIWAPSIEECGGGHGSSWEGLGEGSLQNFQHLAKYLRSIWFNMIIVGTLGHQHDACWWSACCQKVLMKWARAQPQQNLLYKFASKTCREKARHLYNDYGCAASKASKRFPFFFLQILDVSTSQPCNLPGHADAPAAHRSTGNAPCSEVSRGHQPEGS